jgi:hypothetical protein
MMKGWMNILLNKHARSLKTGALKHNIKWDTAIGAAYRGLLTWLGLRAMRFSRWCFRKSVSRCTWCGANCGLDSSISPKGLRCTGCTDKPTHNGGESE